MATSFIAVGPVGMSIIVNQSIGSSPSQLVFDAIAQIMLIEITGQTMNLTTSTKTLGTYGIGPEASPRFILRSVVAKDTPTTTTCKLTDSWPMFDKEDVSRALRKPPSSELLKNARCNWGTRPMIAPRTAPIKALLKKAYAKSNKFWVRGDSLSHWLLPHWYSRSSTPSTSLRTTFGRREVCSFALSFSTFP